MILIGALSQVKRFYFVDRKFQRFYKDGAAEVEKLLFAFVEGGSIHFDLCSPVTHNLENLMISSLDF